LSTISELLLSIFIKTSWPAHTKTSLKDRQIGAKSIGLTIPGKAQLSQEEEEEEAALNIQTENE
jgi:hypothetical protein